MDKILAVVDSDFVQKIGEIRSRDPYELFCKHMDELNCIPVVHPYVMEHELFSCELAKKLLDNGVLRTIEYEEFMPATRKKQYESAFQDLYHVLTMNEFGTELEPDNDIFTRHAKKSYGEIHSVLMASQMQIPIFYSNDHSGKTLCLRFRNLVAKNIQEICLELQQRESCSITSKERKYLCHTK